MPTYEFHCQKCKKAFELTCSITAYVRRRKRGIKCPECGSSTVVQQISALQVQTSKKSWGGVPRIGNQIARNNLSVNISLYFSLWD